MVGLNQGTITQTWASVPIVAGDNSAGVGGLAGVNQGTIAGSSGVGSVTGGNGVRNFGGLVGENFATIANAYVPPSRAMSCVCWRRCPTGAKSSFASPPDRARRWKGDTPSPA